MGAVTCFDDFYKFVATEYENLINPALYQNDDQKIYTYTNKIAICIDYDTIKQKTEEEQDIENGGI